MDCTHGLMGCTQGLHSRQRLSSRVLLSWAHGLHRKWRCFCFHFLQNMIICCKASTPFLVVFVVGIVVAFVVGLVVGLCLYLALSLALSVAFVFALANLPCGSVVWLSGIGVDAAWWFLDEFWWVLIRFPLLSEGFPRFRWFPWYCLPSFSPVFCGGFKRRQNDSEVEAN